MGTPPKPKYNSYLLRRITRWGYKDKMKQEGPLPRLKNDSKKLPTPEYIPKLR